MFGPKRGHFILIFDNFFKDFFLAIVGIVILIVGSVSMEEMAGELFIFAFIFISPITKIVGFLTTKYEITQSSLIVYTGLLNKKTTEIHKSTISTVDTSQSLLQQLIGVSKLKVDNSAQGAGNEVVMAFKTDVALHIKGLLVTDVISTEKEDEIDNTKKIKIKPTSFVALGLLQSKLSFFFKIYAMITVLSPFVSSFLPNIEEQLIGVLDRYFPFDRIASEEFIVIVGVILLFVAVAFVVGYIISLVWSIATTLITFYNFTLSEKDGKLSISYGLMKKRNFTIPKEKICGVNLTQSSLMRMLKVYRMDVYAIGYGGASDGEVEQTIFYPLGKKSEIIRVMADFLPEFSFPQEFKTPSKKAFKYFFFNFWFFLFTIGIIVGAVLQNPYVVVIASLLDIITVLYITLSYKVTAVSINEKAVTFVRGGYQKTLTIVPTNRIESVQALTTKLKQKRGICSIKLSYFAPLAVANLTVKNMSYDEFYALENKLEL